MICADRTCRHHPLCTVCGWGPHAAIHGMPKTFEGAHDYQPTSEPSMKTAHQWAVELTHERIEYGTILAKDVPPEVFDLLKQAIFRASRQLIQEVQDECASQRR